MIGRIIVI